MSWIAVKALLGGAWKFLRAIPWPVWLALALIAGALYYGHTRYEAGEAAGKSQVQADFDAYRARLAELTRIAAEKARKAEEAQRNAFAAIDADYQKRLVDANAKQAAVVADLRAGNLRLRQHWQGCPAAPVPGAATVAAEPDAAADLRDSGAGSLVRIGAACDAQVSALQEALRRERGE